jgi:hypothetical protein
MDTQYSITSIFQQIFESFDHFSFSPKARSKAERCHWKRKVFETARFWIVWCVFTENVEWNLAFLVKTPSNSNRYRRKRRVKLCAFSSILYSAFREEAELLVFSKNVKWNEAFSPKTLSETVHFWQKHGIHENSFI